MVRNDSSRIPCKRMRAVLQRASSAGRARRSEMHQRYSKESRTHYRTCAKQQSGAQPLQITSQTLQSFQYEPAHQSIPCAHSCSKCRCATSHMSFSEPGERWLDSERDTHLRRWGPSRGKPVQHSACDRRGIRLPPSRQYTALRCCASPAAARRPLVVGHSQVVAEPDQSAASSDWCHLGCAAVSWSARGAAQPPHNAQPRWHGLASDRLPVQVPRGDHHSALAFPSPLQSSRN